MRKIKLALDALRVESFPTVHSEPAARGTVMAHAPTHPYSCTCPVTAIGATCEPTCDWWTC